MSRNAVTARRGVQCAACGATLIDRTGYRGWTAGYRRRRLDRRYCSDACRQRAYRARKRAESSGGVAESGAVG